MTTVLIVCVVAAVPATDVSASDEDVLVQGRPLSFWIERLESGDRRAEGILRQWGPDAKAAVPALIGALESPDRAVRAGAANTLRSMGWAAEGAVAPLGEALKDEDGQVRQAARGALQEIAAQCQRAVPAAVELLVTHQEKASLVAQPIDSWWLGHVVAPGAIPGLIELLSHEDPDVRVVAANGLGALGPRAKAAVGPLSKALSDEVPAVRAAGADALGEIGPRAKQAVPALIQALEDEDGEFENDQFGTDRLGILGGSVHTHVAHALGRIGPAAKQAIPVLRKVIEEGDLFRGSVCAQAMGQMGPEGASAVLSTLEGDNPRTRVLAALTLGQSLPDHDEAVPALIPALSDRGRIRLSMPSVPSGPFGFLTSDLSALLTSDGAALARFVPWFAAQPTVSEPHLYVREAAANAVGTIGPHARQAVPALVEMLKDEKSRFRKTGARVLAELDAEAKGAVPALVEMLESHDPYDRFLATFALRRIGPEAKAAAPTLRRMLKDEKIFVRMEALQALRTFQQEPSEAIPLLVEALGHPRLRERAVNTLADMGPNAKEAIPALVDTLKESLTEDPYFGRPDPDEEVENALALVEAGVSSLLSAHSREGETILRALVHVGADAEVVVPAALKAETGGDVRDIVLSFGSKAVPLLMKELSDDEGAASKEDARARRNRFPGSAPRREGLGRLIATRLLGEIGPDAAEAVPALIGALRSSAPGLRHAAAESLRRIGPKAAPAAPALVAALQAEVAEGVKRPGTRWTADYRAHAQGIRWAAAYALAAIGPHAKEAVPALVEMLALDRDRSSPRPYSRLPASMRFEVERAETEARRAAAHALGAIDPGAIVPALVEALKAPNLAVRREAASALAGMGAGAKEAVPALIEALKDDDRVIRQHAAFALTGIGADAKEAVPGLIRIVGDGQLPSEVRVRVLSALARIGPDAGTVLPALIEALEYNDLAVRRQAAMELAEIGPEAGPAVPALVVSLKGQYPSVRVSTAVALGRIGPGAEAAIPALREALLEKDPNLRVEAAFALWRVDPQQADAVIPLLIAAMERRQPGQQASKALVNIGSAAVPAVIDALRQTGRREREYVVRVLSGIGPSALPSLIEGVTDADLNVAVGVIYALGRIQPLGKNAEQALVQALRDDRPAVREAAASALSRIAPDARGAISALNEASNDPYLAVRRAAAAALKQINAAPNARNGGQ
ncbi:MAG: HEAT repeat domain-containing protein [Planctomycetota bacterium]|jgi:HEAT repeat protein